MMMNERMAGQDAPRRVPLHRRPAELPAWASNLFLFFFTLRIAVTSPVLSLFVNYENTTDGIILEKIHPGSWGILLLGLVFVPGAASRVTGADRKLFGAIVLYLVLIGVVIIESLLLGRTSDLGYLLDSLITAGVAGIIVLIMSEEKRRTMAGIVLTLCLCNCIVSIGEFLLKRHLFEDLEYRELFRPNGIAGHPLETGLWCVLSFMLLWFVKWSPLRKLAAALIIIVGVTTAGARLATVVVFAMTALSFILPPVGQPLVTAKSLQNGLLLAVAFLIIAPIAYFVADSLGLLYRFAALGVADDSAASRVNVYNIFGMISRSEFLYGFPVEKATDLLFRMTKSKLIESSVAIYVFQFGAIGAAILLFGYFAVATAFLRRADRFLVLLMAGFWVCAAGTLVLSGKSAGLMAYFALSIALRKPELRRPRSKFALVLRAPTAWRAIAARDGLLERPSIPPSNGVI